jgi:uncharacterized protein (TIGR02646 family)
MRNIAKGTEPHSLAEHRLTPHADYDNYLDKDTLRACLISEQRGLCCYCMQSIRPLEGSMKIEHWHSQDGYPDEQLIYSNLLGSCMGGDGQRDSVKHCDTAKGNKNLSRNPANRDHRVEEVIRYLPDGTITSSDATFHDELSAVLNLNAAHLKNGRVAALRALKEFLRKRGTLNKQRWERLLDEWSGTSHTNDLQPFCGVIVYWIRKRLARFGGPR